MLNLPTLLILLNAAIVLLGAVIIAQPAPVFELLRRYQHTTAFYGLAVVGRGTFGSLLVLAADATRFPLVIAGLGWLVIGVAASILIMGRRRFGASMDKVTGLNKAAKQGLGIFSILFGGFVIYALV